MTVTMESGRRLIILPHHSIFTPVGDYKPGDPIDPTTVEVATEEASGIKEGKKIIVDNVVEVVSEIAAAR